MAQSRYEKYVIRKPVPPDSRIKWGRADLGIIAPFHFLAAGGKANEFNTMLEYAWVTKDSVFGVTPEKAPHKHDCEEIFLFLGTKPDDPDYLGADIEFWMGEGDETEQIRFNTPTLIFVPKNVLHMPMFCRNVKAPILHVVVGLNIGNALLNPTKYPLRGI